MTNIEKKRKITALFIVHLPSTALNSLVRATKSQQTEGQLKRYKTCSCKNNFTK